MTEEILRLMADVRRAVTKQVIAPSEANEVRCDAADAALYDAIAKLVENGVFVRRAPKVDSNQSEIVEALRKAGAFVQSLAGVADGCPDLLVGYGGVTAVVEVKDGRLPPSARRLTPDQLKWHSEWKGGPLAVVCDVESALRVLGVMCPPTKEQT